MATILFWNINKKPLIDDIVYLCHSHQVDVLILAESKISVVALLKALNFNQLTPPQADGVWKQICSRT
jgi:hypothetical protein